MLSTAGRSGSATLLVAGFLLAVESYPNIENLCSMDEQNKKTILIVTTTEEHKAQKQNAKQNKSL